MVARLGTITIGELPCFSHRKEGSYYPRSRGRGGGAARSIITKGRRGLGSTRGVVPRPGNNGSGPFLLKQDGAWLEREATAATQLCGHGYESCDKEKRKKAAEALLAAEGCEATTKEGGDSGWVVLAAEEEGNNGRGGAAILDMSTVIPQGNSPIAIVPNRATTASSSPPASRTAATALSTTARDPSALPTSPSVVRQKHSNLSSSATAALSRSPRQRRPLPGPAATPSSPP
ncbi:hypothetical protein BHM03_00024259 [Ensete ventricosum]|nr:hypothetical protein BHM03_00024259 [Ensete ventricosum]